MKVVASGTGPGECGNHHTLCRRVADGDLSPLAALRLWRGRSSDLPAPDTPAPGNGAAVAAVLAELEALVGLGAVKQTVRRLQAFATVQQWRRRVGLKAEPVSLHMTFIGQPGTGKTTVARLVARLFGAMGLLSRGHLIEVERADLVGEYIGHTAQKTREHIRRALGGVFFVDEAYSLARGGDKDFGREAVDCLVKAMEEHRDDLIVILAGYPHEMQELLSQNPGLRSRLPTCLHFGDYSSDELWQIAQLMLRERQYRLHPEAAAALRRWCEQRTGAVARGNARAVRNLIEQVVCCQALRLVEHNLSRPDDLVLLTTADLLAALAGPASPRRPRAAGAGEG